MKQTHDNLRVIMISSEEVKRIKQSVKDKMIRYGLTEVLEGKSGGGRFEPLEGDLVGQTKRWEKVGRSGVPGKIGVTRKRPMGLIQESRNIGRSDMRLVGPNGTKSGGEASGTRAGSRNGRGRTGWVKVSNLDQEAPNWPLHVQTGPPAGKGQRSANPPVTLGQPPLVSEPISREGWRRGTEVTGLAANDPKLERQLCGSARPPFGYTGFGPLTLPCPTRAPDLPSTNQLLADPPVKPQALPLSGRKDGTAGGGESRPSRGGEIGPPGGQPAVVTRLLGAHQPAAGSRIEKKSDHNGLGVKPKLEREGQGIGVVGPPGVPCTRLPDGSTLLASTIQFNRNQDPAQGPGGGVAGLVTRELGDSWTKMSRWQLGELNDRHNATAWGRYAPPEAQVAGGVFERWHGRAGILKRDVQGLLSQSETTAGQVEEGTKAWKQDQIGGMKETEVSAPLCALAEVADLQLPGQGCPSGIPAGQGQMCLCNDPRELGRRATWPAHPTLTDNQILVGPSYGILQPSWPTTAGLDRSVLMGQLGSRIGTPKGLMTVAFGGLTPKTTRSRSLGDHWRPLEQTGRDRASLMAMTRMSARPLWPIWAWCGPQTKQVVGGQSDHVEKGKNLTRTSLGSVSQGQPGAATLLAPAPNQSKGIATLAWVRGPQTPVLPKKGEAKLVKRLQTNYSLMPSASSSGNRPRGPRRGQGGRKRKIKAAVRAKPDLKTGLGISKRSAGFSEKEGGTGRIRQQYSPFDRGKRA